LAVRSVFDLNRGKNISAVVSRNSTDIDVYS